MPPDPRLITISGPPGSGKTSLARALAKRLNAAFLGYDAYETFTRNSPDVLRDWLDRGAPYEEMLAPGLAQAIQSAQAERGVVVLDTPLGPLDPALSETPFLSVWLSLPLDLALARKLSQLNDSVPNGQEGAFMRWMHGYLQAYGDFVHRACRVQEERLQSICSLGLNGQEPLTANVEKVFSYVTDSSR